MKITKKKILIISFVCFIVIVGIGLGSFIVVSKLKEFKNNSNTNTNENSKNFDDPNSDSVDLDGKNVDNNQNLEDPTIDAKEDEKTGSNNITTPPKSDNNSGSETNSGNSNNSNENNNNSEEEVINETPLQNWKRLDYSIRVYGSKEAAMQKCQEDAVQYEGLYVINCTTVENTDGILIGYMLRLTEFQ